MKFTPLLLSSLFLLLMASVSLSSTPPSQEAEVEILADHQSQRPDGWIHASGNAVLSFQGIQIEAASIVTSTDPPCGLAGSNSSVPLMFLNEPRTSVTIMCRALNSAEVCPGSNVHFAIDVPFV